MSVMSKKIINYFNSISVPGKWEWMLLGIIFLIPFLSFFYGDTVSIIKYEVHFMGSIVDYDGWTSYYEYVKYMVENGGANGGGNYATYDFPMYIILGIWGIPLWVLYGSKGIDVCSVYLAKVYGKSILLIALVISGILIYSICKEIKLSEQHSKWGAFLFASSMCVFTAIGINGQTDVLGMVFILLGLRAYIKHQRINFILWFMLAFMFKMYALFIFVPLLLIVEKKIWKIGVSGIAVFALKFIQGLIFDANDPAMIIKRNFEKGMYDRLTTNRIPFVNGDVPTVFVIFFAICIWCYLHKEISDEAEFYKYAIWIPMISMIGIFVSFESSSYWYVHMCPYLSIMLVYNTSNMKHNFLFETIGLISITLSNYGSRPWAFEIHACQNMLLEKFFGDYNLVAEPYKLENFVVHVHIAKCVGALNAAFVVLMLTFIWMNVPRKIDYIPGQAVRGFAYSRLILNAMVCYVPLTIFVYNLICLK